MIPVVTHRLSWNKLMQLIKNILVLPRFKFLACNAIRARLLKSPKDFHLCSGQSMHSTRVILLCL